MKKDKFSKRIKRTAVLWAAVLFVLTSVSPAANAGLTDELNDLFSAGGERRDWSVLVEALDTGKPLYELDSERRLIPASNMKIFTCAAILLGLGPDYRYETRLHLAGHQQGEVFIGDLIVEGGGDPSIGGRFNGGDLTRTMRDWAAKLKLSGITKIQGNVIGVDDFFDDAALGLNWDPSYREDWYSAEVSGLSFNDGCLDVTIKGGSGAGQKAVITTNPPTHYLRIDNQVTTAGSSKSARGVLFARVDEEHAIKMSGSVPPKRSTLHYVTVPNPTAYFVTVFKETLESEGLSVTGKAFDYDEDDSNGVLPPRDQWTLFLSYQSEPLGVLVEECMKKSQNLYAEHFLKTLGAVNYGIGSYTVGALAIKNVLFRFGCDLDGVYVADGSGLSRENRVSAQTLVQTLRAIDQSSYGESFRSMLPEAGESGTLRNRMRGADVRGRVTAKTGTLHGVRALSGFIEAQSGKTYVFSMLGNCDTRGTILTNTIDKACELIVDRG
ncbi:MAG: D-alanyl-D-alanine carboxypeptidase/D-alanyl-D-alanine-endopeptidase [bacterium]|nr:D-alanyl-D-alanine carboxypeptidase/D-alanyl-D-alanine-endopeptidase [bacterium]